MMSRFNAAAVLLVGWQALFVDACSRLAYKSQGRYYTARSLDWFENPETDIWAFPRGMERDGGMGEGSIEWTSKYGSVVASAYGLTGLDGMNDMGLVVNMLYLSETDTGAATRPDQPKLSMGGWLQYVLDNFATVAEAVAELKKDEIAVHTPPLPMGKAASTHISLSDDTGDNAVFEYLDGKLQWHQSKDYNVMTNSPRFEHQLVIAEYFNQVGGLNFLPGTHTAADRFVRLNYNVNAVPESKSREEALATAMSLIRHISVPFGITDPVYPNLASTYSRQVYDHTERIMYYENVLSPSVFWINIKRLDLSEGSGVRKISYWGRFLRGEVSDEFMPAEPFEFLAPKHTAPGHELPKYMVARPRCIHKNTAVRKPAATIDNVPASGIIVCNDKCHALGGGAWTFFPETKRCRCMAIKEDTKLIFYRGLVSGYTMEKFSDALCAGAVL